jgi:Fe-Mn family superoxide dismutase
MPTPQEISPRPLDPRLLQLEGISRASVEAHYRLYQGYVAKRNEILGALDGVDLGAANQVFSELRALKVDLTFAIGGIKNHELYFAHLGGEGGDPDGAFRTLVERDLGSVDAWRADLRATAIAARGWAWTAYDWDERRLFNYLGDARFRSGTRRRSSRSMSTSTPTSSTTRPIVAPTWTRSSRTSTGAW